MKIKFLLVGALITFSTINAQVRTCETVEQTEKIRFNPLMKKHYEDLNLKFENELSRIEAGIIKKGINNTLIIPVAVHFPTESNSNRSCLVALAQNQIDILNDDFTAQNSDMSIWNTTTGSYFPSVNIGSIDVQFVLATQNHPANTDPNLVNGQPAVTIGYNFAASSDWNSTWAGYLNIVVDNLSGGTLGYAYLGSSPASGSAIFINSEAFASGSGCGSIVPGAPYNLGRTLTHELGHYLNLKHIWGDSTCGNDGVSDTPLHNTSNGGCPPISHLSTCSGTPRELTMNYMDYTNDACMYMFTQGQANRMQAHLNTISDDFNQDVLLNTDVFQNNLTFSIYPNPNNGEFSIQLNENFGNGEIKIYDVTGKIVFKKEILNASTLINVSINEMNSGFYMVYVDNGNLNGVKKLVIE